MKLKVKDYEKLFVTYQNTQKRNPNWTKGQCYMWALRCVDEHLAQVIEGSMFDPSNNRNSLRDFFVAIY